MEGRSERDLAACVRNNLAGQKRRWSRGRRLRNMWQRADRRGEVRSLCVGK